VNDAVKFRIQLDELIVKFPKLFPESIKNGYQLKEIRVSQKLSLPIRRIRIGIKNYTIRPSFVMPYMTAIKKRSNMRYFCVNIRFHFKDSVIRLGTITKNGLEWNKILGD
jgi:hypothetical protein